MRTWCWAAVVFVAIGCGDDGSGGAGESSGDPATDGGSAGPSTSASGASADGTTSSGGDPSTATSTATATNATDPGSSSGIESTTTSGGTGTTAADACTDGELSPGETDIDCGGSCAPCEVGGRCESDDDCADGLCDGGSCLGPAAGCDLGDVQGPPGGAGWGDSYSVDGECYCDSTFDHAIGEIEVDTPCGTITVLEICEALGPGPGADGNPVYNDIQCGNGPPNDAGDEDWCPGRVDQGEPGCCTAGPTWNFDIVCE